MWPEPINEWWRTSRASIWKLVGGNRDVIKTYIKPRVNRESVWRFASGNMKIGWRKSNWGSWVLTKTNQQHNGLIRTLGWEMTHWRLGQHAKNKMMVKFPRDKKTNSKKGDMSRKVARTATSTKDVSQIRLSDKSYTILTTFGPSEINHDKTEKVVYQGEFINIKVLFQHKYYASNNTHFLVYLLCF